MRHAHLVSTCAALVVAGALAAGCGGGGGGGGGAPPGNNPPVTAHKLTFVVPPTTVPVGARQLSPVQVAVQDANNATVADTRVITLTIATATPGGVTITGTTQVAAVHGVATFDDITFTATASVTLRATASGASDAVSSPFTVGAIPASDGLGHIDAGGAMNFNRSNSNDSPDASGLDGPVDVEIDTTLHRAWVVDTYNERVLMFALGNGDDLTGVDLAADLVLGQPNFHSNVYGVARNRLDRPHGVACDPSTSRVFVADRNNHRVLVFDVGTNPTNGMNAINVLGQPDFVTKSPGCTQSSMNSPEALAFDPTTGRLFVADVGNLRVLVFDADATTIVDGDLATHVLGATDFVTPGATTVSESAVGQVAGLALDPPGARLFVSDGTNSRVCVFDLAGGINNGMNAVNVLGQPDLTTTGTTTPPTANGFYYPAGLWHDDSDRLFVADRAFARVLVFDTATLTDGEDAVNVLGRADFVTGTFAQTASVSSLVSPLGVAGSGDRLWIAEDDAHRVLVFDTSTITDGEDAIQGVGHVDNSVMNFDRTNRDDSPHADAFTTARDVLLDEVGHRLFVSDSFNHRVLVFELSSTNDFVGVDREADIVLGQADFKSDALNELEFPCGMALDGGRLFVSDSARNRVVVYDATTLTNGAQPIHVLGQPDLSTTGAGTAADQMDEPAGLALDGSTQRLFVADAHNHRVLVFDVATVSDGEAAVVILGQPGPGSAAPATTRDGMYAPLGVAVDPTGSRLFVTEQENHRVLVFDTTTLADGQLAANVIGQPDFDTNTPGSGASGLQNPASVAYDAGRGLLFVAASDQARCVAFDVASITNGEPAVTVLGQVSMNTTTAAAGIDGLDAPCGLAVDRGFGRVWVVDLVNARVLCFDLP